ncbi:MAG TPA: amidohydrolase family protein [Vicinamibacterales bacterium]|nr:amidohydrolase family protein [Vicinamibacterales bacterium]
MNQAIGIRVGLPVCLACLCLAFAVQAAPDQTNAGGVTVFTNARIIAMGPGIESLQTTAMSIVVRDGKVAAVDKGLNPAGARIVDLAGTYVVPGFVAAHAHISDVNGLKPRAYTEENTRRQLGVYARYGVTTVFSLGGEQAPAFALRDAQSAPGLDRARIFVAGDVITGRTPDEARQNVARVAALKPDIIKIRVDDNLGTTAKMTPDVYRAVIEEAHARKLRVAAHIFYLDDAKDLLKAGVDMIAHSVRDKELDDETILLMRKRFVPYCPTLTREISTFVYESTPAFFNDPFFLREADKDVVAQLQDPARQKAMASSATAQRYKAGLEIAKRNLKKASDAGVLIVMGTDSGPSAERFQGFFEHLEMSMMAEAGMAPGDVVRAATINTARAIGRNDIGGLTPGMWADMVVLTQNPARDISATRAIKSVWIAGVELKR